MILYFLPASIVFAFCATRLVQDSTTETSNLGMWLFLTLAALLWPVTSPSILRKQYLNLRDRHQGGAQSLSPASAQWLEDELSKGVSL